MIKNWTLFLESNQDDWESHLKKLSEDLKQGLYKSFSKFFIGEYLLRQTGEDVDEYLEKGVDIIMNQILESFEEILSNKNFDEETQEFLIESIYQSAVKSKETMIKKSFKEGISNLVDKFTELLIEYKRKQDSEGEEWKQPKSVEYEDLSKSEIQKIIDDTFDNRDKNPNWKKEIEYLTSLPNYIKESTQFLDGKQELIVACKEVAELLVNFCTTVLKVK